MPSPLRIATWNVNSLRVRLAHVLNWLERTQSDVLALQETKLEDVRFPRDEIEAAGYHVCFSGQKTYNGVAILSRIPPQDIVTDISGLIDPQRRILAASYGPVRVVNLYVPNGESLSSDKYKYKLAWLESVTGYLRDQLISHPELTVMGDFNIAPEDRDVYEPAAWEGQVLCSAPERAAYAALLDCGFIDTFRMFPQPEKSFSWWDYRLNAFRRDLGLRIDHVLASQSLAARCRSCVIDKAPRAWERPSDHTPVVACFNAEISAT